MPKIVEKKLNEKSNSPKSTEKIMDHYREFRLNYDKLQSDRVQKSENSSSENEGSSNINEPNRSQNNGKPKDRYLYQNVVRVKQMEGNVFEKVQEHKEKERQEITKIIEETQDPETIDKFN